MKLIALPLTLLILLATPVPAADPVIDFGSGDAEMNAAIAEARSTLDLFLTHAKPGDPRYQDVSVKVAFPTTRPGSTAGHEHIWVSPFEIGTNEYVGALANEPRGLSGLSLGSKVRFTKDMISDWSVVQDGVGYGYYTVRVMLPQLPKDQAAGLRDFLSKDPVPAAWR